MEHIFCHLPLLFLLFPFATSIDDSYTKPSALVLIEMTLVLGGYFLML